MLKRYVLAGLTFIVAGSAFAEVAGQTYIPCVAGAYNCTPGIGQQPIAGPGVAPRPLPAQPGVGLPPRPLPAQPGVGLPPRPLPAQPGVGAGLPPRPLPMQPGVAGGARVGVRVSVNAHSGPAMMPRPPAPRPVAPPMVRPQGGGQVQVRITVQVRAGQKGCGMRRCSIQCGSRCGGSRCGGGRMASRGRCFGRRGRC